MVEHARDFCKHDADVLGAQRHFQPHELFELSLDGLDVGVDVGVIKFNIQHTQGEPARIFVHAMTQEEAERQVDDWFGEAVE